MHAFKTSDLSLQVRAMQIIDELEVNKRGPYGGGMGYVAYNGNMDIALALRTMVIPNPPASPISGSASNNGDSKARKTWTVHLQVMSGCEDSLSCIWSRWACCLASSTPLHLRFGLECCQADLPVGACHDCKHIPSRPSIHESALQHDLLQPAGNLSCISKSVFLDLMLTWARERLPHKTSHTVYLQWTAGWSWACS